MDSRRLFSTSEIEKVDQSGKGRAPSEEISKEESHSKPGMQKPSLEVADSMAREYWHLSNETLVILSSRGVRGAQQERMMREVMTVDRISWDEAKKKLKDIERHARRGRSLLELPYYIAVVGALTVGVVCIPLTFHKDAAKWFNRKYVTTDVADAKDLETPLEVSIWTWSWMEPAIGIASFVLLVLQFSRAQLLKVGFRPYGDWILSMRLARLKDRYPKYSPMVLEEFISSV